MPIFMRTTIRLAIESFNEILPFAITEQGENNVDTQLRYGFTTKSIAHGGRGKRLDRHRVLDRKRMRADTLTADR